MSEIHIAHIPWAAIAILDAVSGIGVPIVLRLYSVHLLNFCKSDMYFSQMTILTRVGNPKTLRLFSGLPSETPKKIHGNLLRYTR